MQEKQLRKYSSELSERARKNIDIEYLIATHPDADHVGGMQEVFKELNIKNFIYPTDAPHDTKTWQNVLSLADSEGCTIKIVYQELLLILVGYNEVYTASVDIAIIMMIVLLHT